MERFASSSVVDDVVGGIVLHLRRGLQGHPIGSVQSVFDAAVRQHAETLRCLAVVGGHYGIPTATAVDSVPLSEIRSLRIQGGHSWLTSASIRFLVQHSHKLRILSVKDTAATISPASLRALVEANPMLQHVELSCLEIERAIPMFPPSLRHLDVSHTNVGDREISIVVERCPELRFLSVAFTAEVSSRSIYAILEKCPKLTELDISGSKLIFSETVVFSSTTESALPQFRRLKARDCGITYVVLTSFLLRCTQLRHLDFNILDANPPARFLQALPFCPQLEYVCIPPILELSQTDAFFAVAEHCRMLKGLELSLNNRSLLSAFMYAAPQNVHHVGCTVPNLPP